MKTKIKIRLMVQVKQNVTKKNNKNLKPLMYFKGFNY
jgi:hypothetical protein